MDSPLFYSTTAAVTSLSNTSSLPLPTSLLPAVEAQVISSPSHSVSFSNSSEAFSTSVSTSSVVTTSSMSSSLSMATSNLVSLNSIPEAIPATPSAKMSYSITASVAPLPLSSSSSSLASSTGNHESFGLVMNDSTDSSGDGCGSISFSTSSPPSSSSAVVNTHPRPPLPTLKKKRLSPLAYLFGSTSRWGEAGKDMSSISTVASSVSSSSSSSNDANANANAHANGATNKSLLINEIVINELTIPSPRTLTTPQLKVHSPPSTTSTSSFTSSFTSSSAFSEDSNGTHERTWIGLDHTLGQASLGCLRGGKPIPSILCRSDSITSSISSTSSSSPRLSPRSSIGSPISAHLHDDMISSHGDMDTSSPSSPREQGNQDSLVSIGLSLSSSTLSSASQVPPKIALKRRFSHQPMSSTTGSVAAIQNHSSTVESILFAQDQPFVSTVEANHENIDPKSLALGISFKNPFSQQLSPSLTKFSRSWSVGDVSPATSRESLSSGESLERQLKRRRESRELKTMESSTLKTGLSTHGAINSANSSSQRAYKDILETASSLHSPTPSSWESPSSSSSSSSSPSSTLWKSSKMASPNSISIASALSLLSSGPTQVLRR